VPQSPEKFGAALVAQQLVKSHENSVSAPMHEAVEHRAAHADGSGMQLNPSASSAHVAQSPLHIVVTGRQVPDEHSLQVPEHAESQQTRSTH
jgi:hypothetical protein